MSDEIKQAVQDGIQSIEAKMAKQALEYERQVKEVGDVNANLKSDIEKLATERAALNDRLTDLEQKGARHVGNDIEVRSLGQQFVASDVFGKMSADDGNMKCRVEVKNTILSNGDSVLPQQKPGVVPGAFVPLTVYNSLPHAPATSNSVEGIREESYTNNAAEVAEGALKPETDLVFGPFDFPVRTVAHTLKVSKNLLADSGAVAAYIDNRLRHGVMERVDRQIVIGNGTPPNLSGILNTGNYTVYTPTAGDNLFDAINRAKWTLWAAGWIPNVVYVNPGDWGAMEILKDNEGRYINGMPGMMLTQNPFQVQVIPSPFVPAGEFAIGAFNRAVTVWDRQGVVVEAGYENDDFTRNLVTLRAEMRLALEISIPSAILGGDFTTGS